MTTIQKINLLKSIKTDLFLVKTKCPNYRFYLLRAKDNAIRLKNIINSQEHDKTLTLTRGVIK